METLTRICLTGAESTGKSELAQELARRFSTIAVPEYAREYAISVGRPLEFGDVEPIARGQIASEDRVIGGGGLLILDTDLLSTIAYSRYYWGRCPDWIEAAARERLADLYLFLHTDVLWIPDPARDGAVDREKVHAEFHRTLSHFDAPYVSIRGTWEERERKAIEAIRSL